MDALPKACFAEKLRALIYTFMIHIYKVMLIRHCWKFGFDPAMLQTYADSDLRRDVEHRLV